MFARKADAQRFLTEMENSKLKGAWTDPALGRVLFREWFGEWQRTTTRLRPNTEARDERLFRRRFWLPATRAAALEGLRIHDLRHTAVALWIAAGANPKEVAARAGHASVSFTLDRYGHLYPEADLSLRERLDAIWSASGGGSWVFAAPARPRRDRSGCAARTRRQVCALTCWVGWWA